jgi:uncharacterized membrane-anchored protein YitT (DUF2179 family)
MCCLIKYFMLISSMRELQIANLIFFYLKEDYIMNNLKNFFDKNSIIMEYSLLIIGSIILAFTTAVFMIPCNIGSGGVTGIALSLNKIFGAKVGLTTMLINAPLFIFGYKLLGKKFTIRSIFVVVITSVLIDNMNKFIAINQFNDTLLASIFCGALFGVGMSFIFIAYGSTGGLDISAKIINNNFKSIQLSTLLLLQDIVVYILVGVVMGPRSVMYAIIMSFVRSKTMDTIQESLASSRQCVIICEESDSIINEIQTRLARGVTVLDAVGGYSSINKKFIYLVIQRNQLSTLKEIVSEIDPTSFVTISPVNNILGNFKNRALTVQ